MKKWFIFIKERFEPISHATMIFSLFSANALSAYYINKWEDLILNPSAIKNSYIIAFIIIFLMFFHLRLFDEIKDYETDKNIHPERPLARGFIVLKEFKLVTFFVILIELLLTAIFLSEPAFISSVFMIGFSLLMFKEFFIGKWLRPKMELYAVTHTFVSCFIGIFISSVITGKYIWQMDKPFFFIALINWMIFNIFEFARKTYAKDEEKDLIESYSKRLKPYGAVILVMINALIALVLLALIIPYLPGGEYIFYSELILTILLGISAIPYSVSNKKISAKIYRITSTCYLILFNLLIAGILFLQI